MKTPLEALAAIRAILAESDPQTPPSAPSQWWNPSPAAYAAFASEHGVPVEAVSPWVTQPNGTLVGSPFPTLPPVTIKSEVLKYAGFGYRPNGRQALFTDTAFALRRKKCDQLAAATTPAQLEYVLTGASSIDKDSAQLQVMLGMNEMNPFSPPHVGSFKTVEAVIAELNRIQPPPLGGNVA